MARGNAGAIVTKLDFATLDGIAHTTLTVREPFLKRDVTFTGVPMGELLSRAGAEPASKSLYQHALDDYHVDLSFAGVAADAMLATRANGKPIPIADGGPIRIVFTSGSKLGALTDNWVWSIESIPGSRVTGTIAGSTEVG